MIKRIKHIKNFGVFQNYRRSGNIEDFKKLNIIYGWNYSGKTTIARLFNCLERHELHNDYNTCEFEGIDQDNTIFSETQLEIPNTSIRVFNSDFIRNNLKWDGQSFDPILLLGEESIQAEEKIEKKKKKIERIESLANRAKNVHNDLNEKVEIGLSNTASSIKTKLELVEPFTKIHLRPIFNRVRQNSIAYKLDSTKEKEMLKYAKASDEDKLPYINEFNPSLNLTELLEQVKALVKNVPEFSKTIDYLLKNTEIANWIGDGMTLHKGKDKCEYCGNTISEKRKEDLLAHFSEDLENHKEDLKVLSKKLNDSKLQISQHNERNFYPLLREKFKKVSTNLKKSINEYNSQIETLDKIIQTKREVPFKPITDFTEIHDCSKTTLQRISDYNEIIVNNNENTEKFEDNKVSAIDDLKNHYAAEFIEEVDLLNKNKRIEQNKKRENNLRNAKQEIELEILSIEAQISNAQKGREKLNEFIYSFLGREEIKIEVIKEGDSEQFSLKRNDDIAVNLSEGEKTAIAFSFYLTKLLEIEDLSTTVVYIDDPISSLDSNHIFQVNALLRDFFFQKEDENSSWELKCNQLFISTHNYEFFSLLRELPLTKENREYYYVKRIDEMNATLDRMPKAIRNYTSEYHFLFNEILSFYNSENKDEFEMLMNIPNAVRRFVELYTYSKIPGNRSSTVDERADRLFGKAKSKRIMKVLHYFSHSNNIERMKKNSDFICDIEGAVKDLMDEIQNDELHYHELVKSVES